MKNILLVVLISISSIHLYAQGSYEKTLDAFTKISATGNLHIELIESPIEKIVIKVDNYKIEDIIAEVDDNALRIKHKPILNTKFTINVFLYYKKINEIKLYAGSLIFNNKPLISDTLDIDIGSGSETNLKIQSEFLHLNSQTGGTLKISGIAKQLDLTANAGGAINAEKLENETATIRISNGSVVHLNTSGSVSGKVLSKAYLNLIQEPNKMDIKTKYKGEFKINH